MSGMKFRHILQFGRHLGLQQPDTPAAQTKLGIEEIAKIAGNLRERLASEFQFKSLH
jgi:hypothetical protein